MSATQKKQPESTGKAKKRLSCEAWGAQIRFSEIRGGSPGEPIGTIIDRDFSLWGSMVNQSPENRNRNVLLLVYTYMRLNGILSFTEAAEKLMGEIEQQDWIKYGRRELRVRVKKLESKGYHEDLEEAFGKLEAEGKIQKEARAIVKPFIESLPEKRRGGSRGPRGEFDFPRDIVEEVAKRYEEEQNRRIENAQKLVAGGALLGWNRNEVRVPLTWFTERAREYQERLPPLTRRLVELFRQAVYNYKL